jgi:hypothetical protein
LRAASLTTDEDRVRRHVLQSFAAGATPNVPTIADQCGVHPLLIQGILERLARADVLLLDVSGKTVLAAYPFSSVPTPHRVLLPGREVFALCAVDALGIPGMVQEAAAISSRCAQCGLPVEIQAQPENVTRCLPVETVVWFPASEDDCCPVAHSRCPSISFFCCRDHLEGWRQVKGQPPGVVLSLSEAFDVGREIFGSMLTQTTQPES